MSSYFSGSMLTSNGSPTSGGVSFSAADTGHPTILRGPHTGNTSGQTVFVLPGNTGTSSQFLQTDGDGTLTWASSSASAGGSNTQFQYNSSGSLAGLANFTTDGTDLTVTADNQLNFRDAQININSSTDGQLDFNADGEIQIVAPIVDINASTEVNVSGAMKVGGALTPNASDGSALGSSTLEWSDLFLADAGVINLGSDQDVTLTHVADTGILLNSTRQLQFNDSGTYIHSSTNGQLDLVSDDQIVITPGSAAQTSNIEVAGHVTLGTTSNSQVNMPYQTITFADAGIYSPVPYPVNVTSNNVMFIDITDAIGTDTVQLQLVGTGILHGSLLNFIFQNAGTNEARIDFGANTLVSGSGLAQYLTFQNTGESASLIYVSGKWFIMNTGATVS